MFASPIPSYVVGISEPHEVGYLLSMNEPRQKGLGELPTQHMLDCDNLKRLWQEVQSFWASRDMTLLRSRFV